MSQAVTLPYGNDEVEVSLPAGYQSRRTRTAGRVTAIGLLMRERMNMRRQTT